MPGTGPIQVSLNNQCALIIIMGETQPVSTGQTHQYNHTLLKRKTAANSFLVLVFEALLFEVLGLSFRDTPCESSLESSLKILTIIK